MTWAMSALESEKRDLTSLVPCNILPVRRVRHGSIEVLLQNCGSNFSVVDRTKLVNIFRDHVAFLDFSLEEVRQLHPFLEALDIS